MTKIFVALVHWRGVDEICEAIASELSHLGYEPRIFNYDTPAPAEANLVFTFGPYDGLLRIPSLWSRQSTDYLPTWVHWNTEGLPDLKIPWRVMQPLADWRSWVGRLSASEQRTEKFLACLPPLSWLDRRMMRFHYLGDYRFAYRQGWLNVLADSSAIYSRFRTAHGLPTTYAPWGAVPDWYADLHCQRDIDVVWMGKRATKRRSQLIDQIREQLDQHAIRMLVVDNIENRFVFGAERTELLNRTKITLNITRTWFDDNFSRFTIAAPNRSLVVSEKLLPHCPEVQAGVHYVAAPAHAIADAIRYYLAHPHDRECLVENAYQLVTTQLTFANTVKTIMQTVHQGCPRTHANLH